MKHLITAVDEHSVASRLNIEAGSYLCAIDSQQVQDIIDYELFVARSRFTLDLETPGGRLRRLRVRKGEYEPMGLSFETGLMSPLRSCKNHCIFCFIDQMPKGIRPTLEVKDDDWRLSLIMGNYVTLTNVGEAEFQRILDRRVSPLYISVHATDPGVRRHMMKNPDAGLLMPRLQRLRDAGLMFHAQAVVCPGVNDGAVLRRTIAGLADLHPAARSLAVVPVGVTRHRAGLEPIEPVGPGQAAALIDLVEREQLCLLPRLGTRFVFAADELYLTAGRQLPLERHYEGYPQLENGVGLLRRFEADFRYQLGETAPLPAPAEVDAACGVSAAPFLCGLFRELVPYGVTVNLQPIRNNFFGATVTVSGLVTAGDIAGQLRKTTDTLVIPSSMLRAGEDVFLDGRTLGELEGALGMRVVPLCADDGAAFVQELFALVAGKEE